MLNFEKIINVLHEELGDSGIEAITDAINYYLLLAGESDFGCFEDQIVLYAFLYSLNCMGFDYSKPDYSALKKTSFR